MGRLRPHRPPAATPLAEDELDAIWTGCEKAFAASQAPGSRSNVHGTARLYSTFCLLAGLPAFPVNLRSVAAYMVDYVHRGNSPESLEGVLSRLKRYTLPPTRATLLTA